MKIEIVDNLNKIEKRISEISRKLEGLDSAQHKEEIDSEELPFDSDVFYKDFESSRDIAVRLSNEVQGVFKSLNAVKKMLYLISSLCVFSVSLSLFVFFYTAVY